MAYQFQFAQPKVNYNTPQVFGRQLAQDFRQGFQTARQAGIDKLKMQALGGDPRAMAQLQQVDPNAFMAVQQSAAQSAENERKREMDRIGYEEKVSKAMDDFGRQIAKARNAEEAQAIHNQLLKNPLYRRVNQEAESAGDAFNPAEDLLEVRAMYGSGYGDMDLKDVINIYEDNVATKDLIAAENGIRSIKRNYKTYSKDPEKGIAAGFGVAKTAIQLVESGVVRPEEFAAATGIVLPGDLSPGSISSFLTTKFKGGLQPEQIDSLAKLGIDAYNAKVGSAQDLQKRMIDAGLGGHKESVVFASNPAEFMEDFTIKESDIIPDPAIQRGEQLEAEDKTDKEILNILKAEGLIK